MDWVFLQRVSYTARGRALLFADLPALKDCLRLYDPSIAASNERMVSNGRSRRGRVGLDLSGSTRSEKLFQPSSRVKTTPMGRSIPMMFPSVSRCSISRSKAAETSCVTATSANRGQLALWRERDWRGRTWLGFVDGLGRVCFPLDMGFMLGVGGFKQIVLSDGG